MPALRPNGTPVSLPLLSVDICLQYNGTLAEGTKVNVSAVGFLYPDGQKVNIPSIFVAGSQNKENIVNNPVWVGFEGASLYNESNANFLTPNGEAPVALEAVDASMLRIPRWSDSGSLWPYYQSITWDIQGDYHPYLIVLFNNGTDTSEYYSDYTVHVSGSDVIQQENYARISTWLAVILFFFTVIASLPILWGLTPKKFKEKLAVFDETQKAQSDSAANCQPPHQQNQPNPETPKEVSKHQHKGK
ncbi:hypothetical protein [Methanoregula sp.]|uniref:hypothetical protein n=1 Tax=Methanoregula sp. TaxID=2052170 RepID=UPI003C771190